MSTNISHSIVDDSRFFTGSNFHSLSQHPLSHPLLILSSVMSVQVRTRTAPSVPNGIGTKLQLTETWKIPSSRWTHQIHPRSEQVAQEVDDYFVRNWHFPDDHAKTSFLKAGFSHVTCLYFPLAKDDRIHFACRLLTVLFLIDGMFLNITHWCFFIHLPNHSRPLADVLEEMSFAEGEKLNDRLMELSKGPQYATPDSR